MHERQGWRHLGRREGRIYRRKVAAAIALFFQSEQQERRLLDGPQKPHLPHCHNHQPYTQMHPIRQIHFLQYLFPDFHTNIALINNFLSRFFIWTWRPVHTRKMKWKWSKSERDTKQMWRYCAAIWWHFCHGRENIHSILPRIMEIFSQFPWIFSILPSFSS